ncbi:MAG: PAS domain S-box protein [Calditrichaeota bacterium]|nr:MAG: PAS domain S-box protein [Calditrichota bacterium]
MVTGNILMDEIWQGVLDTVAEGIVVVDSEGCVNHINAFAANALNIEQVPNHGKHFSSVFCPGLPLDKCWVNSALTAGKPIQDQQFEIRKKDDKKCTGIANFTPIAEANGHVNGAIITIRLVDETHLLRQANETNEAVLGSLAEGLFTVDFEWRITSFNRAAERITGWKEETVVGKYCNQIFRCTGCLQCCPIAETLRRGKPMMESEMDMLCSDGRKIMIRANTSILYNTAGEALGGIMSFRESATKQILENSKPAAKSFHGIFGKNKKMLEIYDLIQEISESNATVLILGKSGTGKELVANAIQKLNSRRNKPYVKVNCAAIPDSLIESELMGHVKGAFTDANQDRIGRFELAHTGTIFLDEVGDLTPAAQMRLLRILESGEFQRLGSSQTQKVDVRVLAATNRDLWQMVQDETFREDLYYRLNVIPIALPPLSERTDDLAALIDHFMEKYRCLTRKNINEIADQAYDLLMAYPYPGNVRELENIIEHAFARTKGSVITVNKLPYYLRQFVPFTESANSPPTNGNTDIQEDEEADRIHTILQQCHWNKSLAAKKLGMSRTTLWRRMRELDLLEK